jgi:glutathione S-transferase
MLNELGVEYELRPIESRTGETQTAEFLKLNPRGKIPCLQDGDFTLSESVGTFAVVYFAVPLVTIALCW